MKRDEVLRLNIKKLKPIYKKLTRGVSKLEALSDL